VADLLVRGVDDAVVQALKQRAGAKQLGFWCSQLIDQGRLAIGDGIEAEVPKGAMALL
jgi:hypothetical protein